MRVMVTAMAAMMAAGCMVTVPREDARAPMVIPPEPASTIVDYAPAADRAAYEEAQATMARLRQAGNSCADLDALEAVKANPPWLLPGVAEEFHAVASKRRRERVMYLTQSISELLPARVGNLAAAQAGLPDADRMADELRCYDAAAADKAKADVASYRACLSDRVCAATRQIVPPLCLELAELADAKQQRAGYSKDIATERRNPGWANPFVLSDYGRGLQIAEWRTERATRAVKILRGQYEHLAGQPFDEQTCSTTGQLWHD